MRHNPTARPNRVLIKLLHASPEQRSRLMDHLEQAVRERAYFIWLDGGCGHGSADEHWLAAEAELTSEAEVLAASMETVARLMIFSETAQDNEPAVGKSTAKR